MVTEAKHTNNGMLSRIEFSITHRTSNACGVGYCAVWLVSDSHCEIRDISLVTIQILVIGWWTTRTHGRFVGGIGKSLLGRWSYLLLGWSVGWGCLGSRHDVYLNWDEWGDGDECRFEFMLMKWCANLFCPEWRKVTHLARCTKTTATVYLHQFLVILSCYENNDNSG